MSCKRLDDTCNTYYNKCEGDGEKMKDKDLMKMLLQDGWVLVKVNSSHHVLQKGLKTEVVPIHGKDVPKGLLEKIMKRTGLK